MIQVEVNDREARCRSAWPITSGSVGLAVSFCFSEDWEGLSAVAVFRGSGSEADAALTGTACTVPAEVLSEAGGSLWIGVYGQAEDGTKVIPTVWACAGRIEEGAEPSGFDPAEPAPSWSAQVQAVAAAALEKAEAVEQAAARGDFDGEDGTAGQDGADGADGVSPVVTVAEITGGHRVTITDAAHPGGQSFEVLDGETGDPGEDGFSPTVEAEPIPGGNRVTMIGASTSAIFDVMDGADGQDGAAGPAGPGVPAGGAADQVLRKKSATDYDTKWADEKTEVFWATYNTTDGITIVGEIGYKKLVLCKYNSRFYAASLYSTSGSVGTTGTYKATVYFKSLFTSASYELKVVTTLNNATGVMSTTWTNSSVELAPLASPALTGTPTAPTAAAGTNTTQLATTAFVEGEIADKADADLGVSGASAGQYVKIKTVDGSGKPTSFEPGTPSGGGGASIDLGLTGASVGDLIRVSAVDANGTPTAWKKAPLCEVKTNPNLLDNWYFVGGGSQQDGGEFPINQRGQTSYSTASAYTIDRWKLTSGSVTVAASGLTLNGTLVQLREQPVGQTVTASALLSDGTMITPSYDDTTKTFTLTATGQTIVAVKLELGSEQTLAHQESGSWVLNELPDYQTQQLICMRYLQQMHRNVRMRSINSAAISGNFVIDFMWPLVVPMRDDAVLVNPSWALNEYGGSNITSQYTIGVAQQLTNGLQIRATKSGTSGGATDAKINPTSTILISAEL